MKLIFNITICVLMVLLSMEIFAAQRSTVKGKIYFDDMENSQIYYIIDEAAKENEIYIGEKDQIKSNNPKLLDLINKLKFNKADNTSYDKLTLNGVIKYDEDGNKEFELKTIEIVSNKQDTTQKTNYKNALGPNIGGLQLGMSREEAISVANKILAHEGREIRDKVDNSGLVPKKEKLLASSPLMYLVFGGENDDQLTAFRIGDMLLYEIPSIKWGRDKSEIVEFVKDLSKEYNLPLEKWEEDANGFYYKTAKYYITLDPWRSSQDSGLEVGIVTN